MGHVNTTIDERGIATLTRTAMRRFLDRGGQTPETERRLGEFAADYRSS